MIADFEDFCIWVFVVVDDIWKAIAPFCKRPGPKPECTDSELIAMSLIGECRGWHMETETVELLERLPASLSTHSFAKPVQSPSAKPDVCHQSDPAGDSA